VSLDFRVRVPRGSQLVEDYVAGRPSVSTFFSASAWDLAAFHDQAASVSARFSGTQAAWLDGVRAPGERARARLEAVRRGDGFVVTTGQQPGLFGGPLYSLYKAVTAAVLAEALEQELGRPVAPVFWTASEDHDWAEVRHTTWVDTENQLQQLVLPDVPGAGQQPLHRLAMGPGVTELVDRAAQASPDTELAAHWFERIRVMYAPERTLSQAFEDLLAELLEPLGVLFVQAHDSWLKHASAPVLAAELQGAAAHEQHLAERAAQLEGAGFGVKVSILDGGVNLFVEGPSGRERLYRDGDGFQLRHSGARFTHDELLAVVRDTPDRVSPNVLLRPVVESAVLPTLAYVAGPGELAYWAQLSPLFEAHGIRMPRVVPRLGASVVEAKVGKVLDKFDLDLEALDRPFHELAAERARDEIPDEVRRAMGALRGAIGSGVTELDKAVRALDPTLKGPVGHVRSVALDALTDVERKVMQAVKRESEIALQQIEKAHVHLFPEGRPQERVFNPVYYLVRYGDSFVRDLAQHLRDALPLKPEKG
jgi:bacillithiol biosynthesis cysteine-adding enzyme BshC